MVAVDTYDKIPKLLREVEAGLGGTLSAFEVLWKDFFDTVVVDSSTHAPPVEGGFPFYVLIEARGGDQAFDEERFHRVLESAFEKDLVADAAIANSGAQRQAMWAIRDDIDGLVAKLAPAMAFDVSLPITHANDYTSAVHRRLDESFPGVYRGTTFGHLGDSNVHFMLTVGTSDHAAQRQAMKIVYEELQPYGGSISAEHGIGTEKREFLGVSRNETEIELMRVLKQALDPKGLLNPGKVI